MKSVLSSLMFFLIVVVTLLVAVSLKPLEQIDVKSLALPPFPQEEVSYKPDIDWSTVVSEHGFVSAIQRCHMTSFVQGVQTDEPCGLVTMTEERRSQPSLLIPYPVLY